MKRSRRVLEDIHTGEATGYTWVISAMGMKEKRMALKMVYVNDATRLNTKVDARLLMTPTDDCAHQARVDRQRTHHLATSGTHPGTSCSSPTCSRPST